MSEPLVLAIMLTRDRPEMAARAIQSFRNQTYSPRCLAVWDTSEHVVYGRALMCDRDAGEFYGGATSPGRTIGVLRNEAIKFGIGCAEMYLSRRPTIIVHWDDDDWSHPRRIEEQVALLLLTSKYLVGYREVLFWDTRPIAVDDPRCGSAWQAVPGAPSETPRNEAWVYRHDQKNMCIGASYCYETSLWEDQPFPDAPHEDRRWWLTPLVSRTALGITSLGVMADVNNLLGPASVVVGPGDPRLICGIHGRNTESYDRRDSWVWRRAPEYDAICAERMALCTTS